MVGTVAPAKSSIPMATPVAITPAVALVHHDTDKDAPSKPSTSAAVLVRGGTNNAVSAKLSKTAPVNEVIIPVNALVHDDMNKRPASQALHACIPDHHAH